MRWGFIGASNIAERVIPSLRKIAGQELVAVCSRSAPRAQQFAEQQGLTSAWQKYGGAAMPRQQVTNGNLYQG